MAENDIDREKKLKLAVATYEMYENTKKDTKRKMKEKTNKDGSRVYSDDDIVSKINLITEAENEFLAQFQMDGGNLEELSLRVKKKIKTPEEKYFKLVAEAINKEQKNIENVIAETKSETNIKLEQEYIPAKGDYNPEAAFDVIPLPSKGECYRDKVSRASVAYLTAYDENMILSPNLYKQNLILDYILQEKLLSKQVDPMDLLEGDRDAIILFLRASGYGNEYPITVTDDKTGKEFETIVDLSKLRYKEFNLKGDSNGWFDYKLPVSGNEIKFRFPTHRDILILEKLDNNEDANIKKAITLKYVKEIEDYVENDKNTSAEVKTKLLQSVHYIENWSSEEEEDMQMYNHSITNRLNLLIMAVDGITDKGYIANFIKKMNVKDSYMLRKYITDNNPGIDYTITVQRPESLGGGSFETFLQLDELLFLNLPY